LSRVGRTTASSLAGIHVLTERLQDTVLLTAAGCNGRERKDEENSGERVNTEGTEEEHREHRGKERRVGDPGSKEPTLCKMRKGWATLKFVERVALD
jgi:hypothetical protein